MIGTIALTCSAFRISASIPFSRLACTRREIPRMSPKLWPRVEDPPLTKHEIVVELLAEVFPQLQGHLVQV